MLKAIIIESIRKPKYRNILSHLVCMTKPKEMKLSKENELQDLINKNYLMLPNLLTGKEVTSLKDKFSKYPLFDRWRPVVGTFSLDDRPMDTHVANVDVQAFIDNKDIIELANHPLIIEYVSNYLGCKPILDTIDAWWSFSGHNKPEEAEFFHRDNDSLRFIKFFIYLTDVDDDSGPHTLVVASRNKNRYLTKRKRYTDEEVNILDNQKEWQVFKGPAGTNFLEDTYALHKGALPLKKERLLLQFRYSIYPTIFSKKIPILDQDTKLDTYTNQLFIK